MKFSYRWVTDEETRKVADEILRRSLEKFLKWRAAGKRSRMSLREQFHAWWVQGGPTNFTSMEDNRRYRAELWTLVERADNERLGTEGAVVQAACDSDVRGV